MNDAPDSSSENSNLPPPSRKSRRKREKPHVPALHRVINLLVLVLLLIGLADYLLSEQPEEKVMEEASAAQGYQEGRLAQKERIDMLARLFPISRPSVGVTLLEAGKGPKAHCGQVATYRLHAEGIDGPIVSEPRKLRIGEAKEEVGLSLGILGMQVGEKREAVIPLSLMASQDEKPVDERASKKRTIELLSLEPSIPEVTGFRFRRFTQRSGTGLPLRCGDAAVVSMTIYDGAGKQLFSSATDGMIYVAPGEGTLPLALEQAVIDIAPGGVYTIILPADQMVPLNTSRAYLPEDIKALQFPKDKIPSGLVTIIDLEYPARPDYETPPAEATRDEPTPAPPESGKTNPAPASTTGPDHEPTVANP